MALGVCRKDVGVMNVVCCRTPGNRSPTFSEINACSEWRKAQLEALNPDVVVLLGETACRTFGVWKGRMRDTRGWCGEGFFATYHPAAIFYNPNLLPEFRKDLAEVLMGREFPCTADELFKEYEEYLEKRFGEDPPELARALKVQYLSTVAARSERVQRMLEERWKELC